jgi:hypothetical protein
MLIIIIIIITINNFNYVGTLSFRTFFYSIQLVGHVTRELITTLTCVIHIFIKKLFHCKFFFKLSIKNSIAASILVGVGRGNCSIIKYIVTLLYYLCKMTKESSLYCKISTKALGRHREHSPLV